MKSYKDYQSTHKAAAHSAAANTPQYYDASSTLSTKNVTQHKVNQSTVASTQRQIIQRLFG
ncbi:MAG TPA: hypothetical protein VL947_07475, partial [Cytophagales bacterium]|nr:hypothetical protein [Cytophagales bacterium]